MQFDHDPQYENKIALFDMDETIVDFTGPLTERLQAMLGPDEQMPSNLWDMPQYMYARAQAIKREPGFWRNLPTLAWGMEVLEIAREIGFDIHILTKGPTTGPQAWAEKVEWVQAEFGDEVTLHITQDKRIAYGRVFIDDYWPFMELWLKHRPRGLGIVPYASDRHPNLVSYQDGLGTIRDRLLGAYNRE